MPRPIPPRDATLRPAATAAPTQAQNAQRRQASRARRAASDSVAQQAPRDTQQLAHGPAPYTTTRSGGRSPQTRSALTPIDENSIRSPGAQLPQRASATPALTPPDAPLSLAEEFDLLFPPSSAQAPIALHSANEAVAYAGQLAGLRQQIQNLWSSPLGMQDPIIGQAFAHMSLALEDIYTRTLSSAIDNLPVLHDDDFGPAPTGQAHVIASALADLDTWYADLGAAHPIVMSREEIKDLSCPITLQPVAELTHPVLVHAGSIRHVFEGHDLLTWLAETVDNETHPGTGLNPLTRAPLPLDTVFALNIVPDWHAER